VQVSLLDNRGEGFLGQPPRLQKHWEVAALAQLWDTQLDRPGAGLPDPLSVAVAVIGTESRTRWLVSYLGEAS
jgi:hypothetical protein